MNLTKRVKRLLAIFVPSRKWRRKLRGQRIEKEVSLKDLQTQIVELQNTVSALFKTQQLCRKTDFSRLLQLLNLEILKEIDRICRRHNLQYWLSYGSALGAIRHGGFIPWDDDIDICMLYEDWLKFNELAKTELDADFVNIVLPGDIGRVYRKEFSPTTDEELVASVQWSPQKKLFFGVDVFPVYWLTDDISDADAIEFIWTERENKQRKIDIDGRDVVARERIQRETDDALKPIIGESESKRVFASLHCLHSRPYIWYSEDIFPLREVTFEDGKFFIPHEAELILWQEHGDFWQPRVDSSHVSLDNLDRLEIKKLIYHLNRIKSFK